jgi:hypothetical protein
MKRGRILIACLTALIAFATLTLAKPNGSLAGEQTDNIKMPPIPVNREASAGSNAGQAVMAAQAPLLLAAQIIKNLDPTGAGLGGIQLQVDKGTIHVWWKGRVPTAVRKVITREQRSKGIKIVLEPSQHSQRELAEAARSIMSKEIAFPGVIGAGPLVDGSGLAITVTDSSKVSSLKFPFPVHFVSRTEFVPLWGGRGADIPPNFAGAVTQAVGSGKLCSTGFSMKKKTGWPQTILTAEHCSCGGDIDFNNGAGNRMGHAEPARGKELYTDSLLIDTLAAAPATYDGGVGAGEFAKSVVGVQSNFVGMFICTSGSATGVHCNIMIDQVNQEFKFGICTTTQPFTEGVSFAHEVSGAVATGTGDSGGPVFTLAKDPSTVNAAGMMFGGFNPTNCQKFGTTCFNGVVFNDIDSLQAAYNAGVIVK